jgi:hypothetical protein
MPPSTKLSPLPVHSAPPLPASAVNDDGTGLTDTPALAEQPVESLTFKVNIVKLLTPQAVGLAMVESLRWVEGLQL